MRNGKAFEYSCLYSIYDRIFSNGSPVRIISNNAYHTAQKSFDEINYETRENILKASNTAVNLLMPLEPRLLYGEGDIVLSIAADSIAIGPDGDVRDVLCERDDGWTIGISCKHNHEALKHPRITEKKDFGSDWLGIPCSYDFIEEISPITDSLVSYGESKVLWRNIEHKQVNYYRPILEAYLHELVRLCDKYQDVPERLMSYFFGSNDFYKVIMMTKDETTTIEAFNMHGTLGSPCGKHRPMTRIPLIKMPTRLIDASFKPNSMTTIILIFDGGWTISMRLHNKDDIAKPTSLAWDVQLVGLPTSTYVNRHSWYE